MESSLPVVTLDGGAATGKSSTARGVAARLGFLHVDTGAHYRLLTLYFLQREIAAEDMEGLRRGLEEIDLRAEVVGTGIRLWLGGREVSAADLRDAGVNRMVSAYAAVPEIRAWLLEFQRSHTRIAARAGLPGIVVEGRDIGSVVFPSADHKFFLEADPDTRQARRQMEGQHDSVRERDLMDGGRKTAPLVCPEGAERIDTGSLSLEQVIDTICQRVG